MRVVLLDPPPEGQLHESAAGTVDAEWVRLWLADGSHNGGFVEHLASQTAGLVCDDILYGHGGRDLDVALDRAMCCGRGEDIGDRLDNRGDGLGRVGAEEDGRRSVDDCGGACERKM